MNALRLVLRGLLHRWRTNLAVACGAALAAAVLVGSLGAGDSVRASLRHLSLRRLGQVAYALQSGERFFHAGLASEAAGSLGGRGAALVALRGAASAREGQARASPVQVLGVGPDFWELGPRVGTGQPELGEQEVLLNEPLARSLRIGVGEELLLRVHDPSLMPAGAPLSLGTGPAAAIRLTVKGVVPESSFGDFSLRVSQAPPLNAFMAREPLARRLGRAGRANTLLLATDRAKAEAERALADRRRLEDVGLSFRRAGSGWELVSERVFLDPPVEAAAAKAAGGAAASAPAASAPEAGEGVLTYFVDRISAGGRSLPYSFVASAGASRLGQELGSGEIALNDWAARQLGARPGDTVELAFRVPAAGDILEKRAERFRVRQVTPILPQDRSLMPEFPGLAGAENCRDWDPGLPIDLSLIGEREERYWDQYRGSPKAFVSLADAQRLWGNRFGRLTAYRFAGGGEARRDLEARILGGLDSKALGWALEPLRELALEASDAGVDFGELFLGLSLFLEAAALLLTALLFQLSVEQRRSDAGTLAALGFPRGRILRLLLAEGALVALAGCGAGLLLGLAFHRAVLAGLRGAWREAVRVSLPVAYVAPSSLLAGFLGGLAASLVVVAAATLRMLRAQPAANLARLAPRVGWGAWVASGIGLLGAGSVLLTVSEPLSFFASGALLLASLLAGFIAALARLGRPGTRGLPTLAGVGLANAARRRGRSLAVASLAACGIFVVAAVAANRRGVPDPEAKSSGTGGFAFLARTAVPLEHDPGRPEGRAALRLLRPELEESAFVGFRVLEGDDASCLNLNRVRQPALLATDPSRLSGRFQAADRRAPDPWALLSQDLGPDTIPAIADQTVITYGLGLEIGRELEYLDEQGRALRVRLVAGLSNSIFQGQLIVAERDLLRHFPSAGGYRFFLIDSAPQRRAAAERGLNRALERYGVWVGGTAERLAEFNSVENTYLAIFGLLGWLGLLVGTLGLGVAVARNVAEMRGELALLRAVGWGTGRLLRLVLAEHLPPLAWGLAGGAAASALAVFPAVSQRGSGPGAGTLLLAVGAIAASALACAALAAAFALRADLLPALRNE